MLQDQNRADNQSGKGEEAIRLPTRYYVSAEVARELNRSLPLMLISRMSYASRQAFDENPSPDEDIEPYIERIAEVDSKDNDYLLPDTPLKEAIFRVILSRGNQPMTAEEISEILSEKWAMTAYPRDISPRVIQRLLDNSQSYCIVPAEESE